ncbi:MAG: hypothetical protein ACFCBV_03815 [Phycisphaerales bacterium]
MDEPTHETVLNEWGRLASILRPDLSGQARIDGSWIGKVTLSLPGETWPTCEQRPLAPIFQLRLDEAPFVPDSLKDIACVTFFAECAGEELDPEFALPGGAEAKLDELDPEQAGWCLRAYKDVASLVEIEQAQVAWPFKSAPGSWTHVELDPPSGFEFGEDEVPESVAVAFEESKLKGVRLGGWPSIIQDQLPWGPRQPPLPDWEGRPIAWKPPAFLPEYAFELTWIQELDLSFGDVGSVYFGRGKADPDWWIVARQSF